MVGGRTSTTAIIALRFVFAPLRFLSTHIVFIAFSYMRPSSPWRRRGFILYYWYFMWLFHCLIVELRFFCNISIALLITVDSTHSSSFDLINVLTFGRQAEIQETSRYHCRYEQTHVNPEPQRIRWVVNNNIIPISCMFCRGYGQSQSKAIWAPRCRSFKCDIPI